ncbi:phage head closure protein [Clostridium gasigenes]|uniref:phage head closure protein n=1 Tax=Clostridium gasigenes TaxID=94869 RepID=UPI0016277CE0|nr:phage head closure protein [Clostridium gasigenes]MBB6622566.1 phage head closure protein [Clostridium gasigenes]
MSINISDFKHRISIEKREKTKDKSGYLNGFIPSNIMNCWAKLSDFYAKELYSSFGSKLEGGINITVRYCKTLEHLDDVEYKDKLFITLGTTSYTVKHIDFHNRNKEFITFKAVIIK